MIVDVASLSLSSIASLDVDVDVASLASLDVDVDVVDLSLYSFLLPLAIVDKMGLLTIPATTFIVWALFGLREIGTLIENPFSRPLQLQIVSDTLALDVREAVNAVTGVRR